jgi:hypothetical protein
MSPYMLESLYERMGKPVYFWPVVMLVIFVALPLIGSIQ